MDYKIHLVSFANKEPFIKSQKILDKTYKKCNIDFHTSWNPQLLSETQFFKNNQNLFNRYKSIGFGLFIWKPYIIYQKLLEISDGDFVYYQDASRYDFSGLKNDMRLVCDFMINNNIDIIPGFEINKPNSILISNECLKYMKIYDDDTFLKKNHIQTSPMIIIKNNKTMIFIKEWIDYCQIPTCILKTSNAHQCDQAILNILLYKYNYNSLLYTEDKLDSKKYSSFWQMLCEYIESQKT